MMNQSQKSHILFFSQDQFTSSSLIYLQISSFEEVFKLSQPEKRFGLVLFLPYNHQYDEEDLLSYLK
jgi:hypothetical protein